MTRHYIGSRITHKDHIYPSSIHKTSHRIVIGGKHGDGLTLSLHRSETNGRNLLRLELVLRHYKSK